MNPHCSRSAWLASPRWALGLSLQRSASQHEWAHEMLMRGSAWHSYPLVYDPGGHTDQLVHAQLRFMPSFGSQGIGTLRNKKPRFDRAYAYLARYHQEIRCCAQKQAMGWKENENIMRG